MNYNLTLHQNKPFIKVKCYRCLMSKGPLVRARIGNTLHIRCRQLSNRLSIIWWNIRMRYWRFLLLRSFSKASIPHTKQFFYLCPYNNARVSFKGKWKHWNRAIELTSLWSSWFGPVHLAILEVEHSFFDVLPARSALQPGWLLPCPSLICRFLVRVSYSLQSAMDRILILDIKMWKEL